MIGAKSLSRKLFRGTDSPEGAAEGAPLCRRSQELLADAEVAADLLRGVLPRLERFLDPLVELLQRSEQGQHAHDYVAGLLSSLESKNVESIAYLHDQEREPALAPD
jgi:hypothetical protein